MGHFNGPPQPAWNEPDYGGEDDIAGENADALNQASLDESFAGVEADDLSGSASGAYVMGLGGGLKGIGSIIEGMAKGNAMDYQAQVADTNASQAEQQGAFNAQKQQLQAAQLVGQAKANYGASGIDTSYGSGAAVLGASAANAELDRLNILHGADIKAANFQNQAQLDRYGASNSRLGGALGGVAGLVTMGGSLALLA